MFQNGKSNIGSILFLLHYNLSTSVVHPVLLLPSSTQCPPTFCTGLSYKLEWNTSSSSSSSFKINNYLSPHSLDTEYQSRHFSHAAAPGSYSMQPGFYPYIWHECLGQADGICILGFFFQTVPLESANYHIAGWPLKFLHWRAVPGHILFERFHRREQHGNV